VKTPVYPHEDREDAVRTAGDPGEARTSWLRIRFCRLEGYVDFSGARGAALRVDIFPATPTHNIPDSV
jgi:hypothetical protein